MSRVRNWLGYLFVIVWGLMFIGIAGIRWEFLPLQPGLGAAFLGAVAIVAYGLLTIPVVLFKLIFRKPLSGRVLSYCVLGLLPLAVLVLSVGFEGFRAPAIHDISTDTKNPPQFMLAKVERNQSDNSTEYEGEVVARLQEEAYPDIQPVLLPDDVDAVVDAVDKTVNDMGWKVLGKDNAGQGTGEETIEAVATSAIFGFEDDVIIRVRKAGEETRVDVRSASRVGLGDLGANAARIRAFRAKLEENL